MLTVIHRLHYFTVLYRLLASTKVNCLMTEKCVWISCSRSLQVSWLEVERATSSSLTATILRACVIPHQHKVSP